ncbi:MAG: sugar phosphate isomerase/epimerase [Faecalicatena sp.]|uniref:sugar phosphate isomerase/epimerase family protein n=1 Tax=Faecalicatena sp. TaxID=2005360 RepID=UPI00258A7CA2|nr:sugar phosphate isomerase/epimerase family protein [Faecalicatena sp.]MCI6465681.1 sugar phosphate isomerase/epimerase [Faecalicatena sp.]MDY5618044.1 sugar phosphate isomerase/epimerase family protein [Lachnospiraceae bacterium]
MKYSLMSLMVNDELKVTKPNFIHLSIIRDMGYEKENPSLEEVHEFLNAHGIPVKNGEMTFEDYVKFAKKSGYDGVDMMDFHLEMEGKEAKKILEKYKITLSAVNIIVPFVSAVTQEKFEKMFSRTKSVIDNAYEAGCRNILLMPSVYNADAGITREQAFHNIVRGLKACVEYGQQKGMTINTETLESIAVPYCSCGEMKRIFDAVPGLKYTHDTGNPLTALENPVEVYEMFKDKVAAVHFKDFAYVTEQDGILCNDGRRLASVPFGEGEIDFRKHDEILLRDQYNGFITIEGSVPAENPLDGAVKSLKYFRDLENKVKAEMV